MNTEKRSYSMAKRGVRAAATRQRIIDAVLSLALAQPQGFTLKAVAGAAGISVQTVLRLFGTKEALVAALLARPPQAARRADPPPEDAAAALRLLYDGYEESGDLQTLAVPREAARQAHRDWVERAFAAFLQARDGAARQSLLYGLLIATDVQVWKLLRRDLGLYRRAAEAMALHLVNALLARV